MLRFLSLAAVLVLAGPLAAADVKLAAVFSDHMVLQRDKPVPVWGKAAPMTPVAVEFQGQKVTGAADGDGRWKVLLAPLSASKVGADLTVTAGTEQISLSGACRDRLASARDARKSWSVAIPSPPGSRTSTHE